ncbi:MAG: hypothetical protein MUC34_09270, partial [Anaerolineae bacterium]|nr:hypothetical protein [Anaerolineae bacterium]
LTVRPRAQRRAGTRWMPGGHVAAVRGIAGDYFHPIINEPSSSFGRIALAAAPQTFAVTLPVTL